MKKVLILDGGFTTQLGRYLNRAELEQPRYDLHVLATNRSAVYKTHLDFLRAGSNIIRTNTYRATVQSFVDYLDISLSEGAHLITVAVQLAQKAVRKYFEETGGDISNYQMFLKKRALIAGTCGSYGVANFDEMEECPSYWDNFTVSYLKNWHQSRIRALLKAGVDLLTFDSIPCVKEAEALLQLLRENPNAHAWITLYCPDGKTLMDGANFQDTAVRCYNTLPNQIVAIGIYCHHPILATIALKRINNLRSPNSNIPLVVCSDKRITYCISGNFKCDTITSYVWEWLTIGVCYIGGALDVNADDIKDICNEVRRCHALFNNVTLTNRGAPCIPTPRSFRNDNKSKM